jgi:hypothetical protein
MMVGVGATVGVVEGAIVGEAGVSLISVRVAIGLWLASALILLADDVERSAGAEPLDLLR